MIDVTMCHRGTWIQRLVSSQSCCNSVVKPYNITSWQPNMNDGAIKIVKRYKLFSRFLLGNVQDCHFLMDGDWSWPPGLFFPLQIKLAVMVMGKSLCLITCTCEKVHFFTFSVIVSKWYYENWVNIRKSHFSRPKRVSMLPNKTNVRHPGYRWRHEIVTVL
jgi:hypothetical protein